jgi:hypothetical protein
MDIALLLARLLPASVFVVAGVAKLADRSGTRQALADFGVPSPLVAPLGALLPLAELAVAAALLPASTAWWGALGALVLLLLFVAGIGVNPPIQQDHGPQGMVDREPSRGGSDTTHRTRLRILAPAKRRASESWVSRISSYWLHGSGAPSGARPKTLLEATAGGTRGYSYRPDPAG